MKSGKQKHEWWRLERPYYKGFSLSRPHWADLVIESPCLSVCPSMVLWCCATGCSFFRPLIGPEVTWSFHCLSCPPPFPPPPPPILMAGRPVREELFFRGFPYTLHITYHECKLQYDKMSQNCTFPSRTSPTYFSSFRFCLLSFKFVYSLLAFDFLLWRLVINN